jgi:hypothetical protein
MKKLWNREDLKSFFRKGQFPTEAHFAYLIDSQVNQLDDGFAKSDNDGLKLAPTGDENAVMSIFKNNPGKGGISFDAIETDDDNNLVKTPRLVLADSGGIGVGTQEPRLQLEVAGTGGFRSRVGTFAAGEVDADGQWQTIVPNLRAPTAFEVVARVDGGAQRGKYAVTHALALGTFGGGNNRIRQTRAYYGWFWNRIDVRWKSEQTNYHLQVRTRQHYGLKADNSPYKIRFHVCALLDDALFR